MKKVITSALILYALAAGCGNRYNPGKDDILNYFKPAPQVRIAEGEKPTRYIDNLVVNTSSSYRTVIRKCEPEGIEDLIGLAKNSQLEEAWVYLPEICEWREVGENETHQIETEEEYRISVTLDLEYLEKLMLENEQSIIYHFHPKVNDEMIEDIRKELEQAGINIDDRIRPVWESGLRAEFAVTEALPSEHDLTAMIIHSNMSDALNPDGSIIYKICSVKGVVEYYLTEEGKKHYQDKDPAIIFDIARMKAQKADIASTNSTEPDPISKIHGLCKVMADEYITIKFTPHDSPAR